MNVKELVLEALENNRGVYLSGAELARRLSVSRNAVWKSVKSLQDAGHDICAAPNRGYCLSASSDILSAQSIMKHLSLSESPFRIEVFRTIGSTNTALKEMASLGEPEGKVIVAEEQEAGRGRAARSFFSPPGTGIYLSLLLRPRLNAADATYITAAAAVAVSQAIEAVAGCEALIKWVNDVFCHGKKVCGILTEASLDMESGGLEYAVLGIGINVHRPKQGFPSEIEDIATAVFEGPSDEKDARSRLVSEILQRFWPYYERLLEKTFLSEYQKRSFIIGHDVFVQRGGQSRKARALEIDSDCHLAVRYEDGTSETLSSGEVSVMTSGLRNRCSATSSKRFRQARSASGRLATPQHERR